MWVLPAHDHHFCVHHHRGQEAGNSGGDCGGHGDGNGGEGSRRWVLLKVSSRKPNNSNTSQEQEEMVSTAAPPLHGKCYLCSELPFLTQPHIQNHHQKKLSPGEKHKWDRAGALKASHSCHDGRKAWGHFSISWPPPTGSGLQCCCFPGRSWRLIPCVPLMWLPRAQEGPVVLAGPLCPQAPMATAAWPGAGLALQHPPALKEQLTQMCSNPRSSLHFLLLFVTKWAQSKFPFHLWLIWKNPFTP